MNSFSFNLSLPVVKESNPTAPCRTPEEVARLLKDTATLAQEAFTVLTLDTKYRVIDRHLITLGILDASLVHPREVFREAAAEEGDHLAWTRSRLDELGVRPSLLNPLWYAGSFAFGAVAGRVGDRFSLGFMVETERQVERHLAEHLEQLPAGDVVSRAIVASPWPVSITAATIATSIEMADSVSTSVP